MAVTHGHGNPNWTRDEVILALDLYLECNGKVPLSDHPRVRQLSMLLRDLPTHRVAARKDSFRNPDGVVFKLENIRKVATGNGLGNVSKIDRAVWQEFRDQPQRARMLAHLIRGLAARNDADEVQDVDETFFEGDLVTRIHSRRERDPKLRKRLLHARRRMGALRCDACHATARGCNPLVEDAMFEAHHVEPLAGRQSGTTRLSDVTLLCANCHRMIHRAIARERRWLTVEEARHYMFATERTVVGEPRSPI
jgi:5-methylcytosine-specific restriction protein A